MRIRNLAALTCALGLLGTPAFAADHVDSPATVNDPAADINDIYAFVNPNDANEAVYVATVNPFANEATRFSDAVVYSFELANGAGIANRIECTFSRPDQQTLDQEVACTGPGGRMVSGPINQVNTNGDFRVFAGLTDDPFYFDLAAFQETVSTGAPQFSDPGTDFFAGLNVMSIVIGLDIDATAQTEAKAHFNQQFYATTDRINGAGIGPGFSGHWFNPEEDGHGFTFEVLQRQPDSSKASAKAHYGNDMLVLWFNYNEGSQVWFFGRGEVNGNTAIIPVEVSSGADFGPDFDPADVTRTSVGNLKITGTDCDSAMVEFNSSTTGFESYDFPIERLTQIKNLPCSFLTDGQIDRMGRPAVNTALISSGNKDAYNAAEDPSTWAAMFQDEIQASLEFVDGLDGVTGNALLGDAETLASVLVDDRLVIATNVPECGPYLAVELTPSEETPSACGGRTLSADVIDATLTALVTGLDGGPVSDGVDSNDKAFRDSFPFLAAPH